MYIHPGGTLYQQTRALAGDVRMRAIAECSFRLCRVIYFFLLPSIALTIHSESVVHIIKKHPKKKIRFSVILQRCSAPAPILDNLSWQHGGGSVIPSESGENVVLCVKRSFTCRFLFLHTWSQMYVPFAWQARV